MKIAIVGATGEVGKMMLTCLDEFQIKYSELYLLASEKSAGKSITYKNSLYQIQGLTDDVLKTKFDFVLFSAGSSVSLKYAQIFKDNGATVIDNSSAFRKHSEIPLIIPEINGHIINNYKGIIANPNCSTIQLLLVLNPLHKFNKISKVVVTTLQSVSGAGHKGIIELENSNNFSIFPKPINRNVIPQIGNFNNDFYCEEEEKMTYETKKILSDPEFNLVATTIRVPVIYGHSESVYIEFSNDINLNEIYELLQNSQAVRVHQKDYITPLEIGESNFSHVSRIRYAGDKKSVFLWNVAHNVRIGAATNAIKILKYHQENYLYSN